jgi:hypothetical protein
MNDLRLVKYLLVLLALPVGLAMCSGDRFRYPCQDPENWEKEFCQKPKCDVTRTCPEHIFKGQRDPRLGMPKDEQTQTTNAPATQACTPVSAQGANCGK